MIVLRPDPAARPFSPRQITQIAERFPGSHSLQIVAGDRTLKIGAAWSYEPSAACLVALGEYGRAEVLQSNPGEAL